MAGARSSSPAATAGCTPLYRDTGKLIWKFDANPKDSRYQLGGKSTRNDFIAAPVIVGNRCYIGTGQDPEHYEGVGHLWCIDITKSGDVSPDLVTNDTVFPPKTKPNPNSAAVWGAAFCADSKVYLGTEDGDVSVFAHSKEMKLLNRVELEQPIRSTPVAVGGVLYVATATHLYAIQQK